MPGTPNSVILPQQPGNGLATLTSPTAITSRANITGTSGLVQLTPTTTAGKKVYQLSFKGKGSTAAGFVSLWRYNGTTSFLFDELPIVGATPSTTVAAEAFTRTYANLTLGPTEQLFVSVTVTQDLTVFAEAADL